MNLHISDREKQVITAALETFRSRKQGVILSAPQDDRSKAAKEIRQPENEYDILSAEHSLMHAITLMSKLTDKPIAYFTNANPSQNPQPTTHLGEMSHSDVEKGMEGLNCNVAITKHGNR